MDYHIIRFTLEIEFPYPVTEDRQTPEEIEDYFNNSRLCRSQLLDAVSKRICVCDESSVKHVRKATEEDMVSWKKSLRFLTR